jgi:hypothetical protein
MARSYTRIVDGHSSKLLILRPPRVLARDTYIFQRATQSCRQNVNFVKHWRRSYSHHSSRLIKGGFVRRSHLAASLLLLTILALPGSARYPFVRSELPIASDFEVSVNRSSHRLGESQGRSNTTLVKPQFVPDAFGSCEKIDDVKSVYNLVNTHQLLFGRVENVPENSAGDSEARGATKSTPFVINVREIRSFYLILVRNSRIVPGTFRMKAYVSQSYGISQSYQYNLVCSLTHMLGPNSDPENGVVAYKIQSVDQRISSWRIEIYDDTNGGPTGDAPYGITFFVWVPKLNTSSDDGSWPITAEIPGVTLSDLTRDFLSDSRAPACRIVSGPTRPESRLEVPRSESWPSEVYESTYRDYLFAGRRIYVQVSARAGTPGVEVHRDLKIRLSFKSGPSGSFVPVCESVLDREFFKKPASTYILGQHQYSDAMHTIWKVEVEDSQSSAGLRSPVNSYLIKTFREIDPESLSSNPGVVRGGSYPSGVEQYFCNNSSGEGNPTMPVATLTGFVTNAVLTITVHDESGLTRQDRRHELESALLQSVSAWNRFCSRCSDGNNSVVRIDQDLFINSSFLWDLNALSQKRYSAVFVLGQPPEGADKWWSLYQDERGPSAVYVPLDRHSDAIQFLCAANAGEIPDFALDVQSFLGCSQKSIHTTEMTIDILNQELSCGGVPNRNVIACGQQAKLVQLNGKDYTFVSRSPTTALFGRGDRPVEFFLVMLHEMGHWLGLQHLNSPNGIMSGTLRDVECIDGAASAALREILEKGLPVDTQSWGLLYDEKDHSRR